MKISTLGTIDITEVQLLRVELELSECGKDMRGTAHILLRTSNPQFKSFPPMKMEFVPNRKFVDEILEEILLSTRLTREKRVLPSE